MSSRTQRIFEALSQKGYLENETHNQKNNSSEIRRSENPRSVTITAATIEQAKVIFLDDVGKFVTINTLLSS